MDGWMIGYPLFSEIQPFHQISSVSRNFKFEESGKKAPILIKIFFFFLT